MVPVVVILFLDQLPVLVAAAERHGVHLEHKVVVLVADMTMLKQALEMVPLDKDFTVVTEPLVQTTQVAAAAALAVLAAVQLVWFLVMEVLAFRHPSPE